MSHLNEGRDHITPSAPATGRLTYVGHATVLVEMAGVRMLTDPLLRGRLAHIRRRVPVPSSEELLPLDAILISHAHADHLDLRSLRRVAGSCTVIAPRGCARILRRADARQIIELAEGETCSVGPIGVTAVPAVHDGRRHPLGRAMPALGFLLDGPSHVYFAGDTDLFDDMAKLAGRVDVALLPIAGWGPRLPRGHLDPISAARAAALIRPAVAVPIHWGTMRSVGMRRDADPRAPAQAFADAVGSLDVPVTARILMPGEAMGLPAAGDGAGDRHEPG
jgi:L-ascorbate metabolism protein UlaG (beta-lactamase superfamily)